MLEVGNLANATEDRSHFGAWVVASSPLILSFNLSDRSRLERVWPFITNRELLAVNQDSWGIQASVVDLGDGSQVLVKPLSDGAFAVALWNLADSSAFLNVTWSSLAPRIASDTMQVRDLWVRQDLGQHTTFFGTHVPGHGVALLKARPA